MSDTVEARLTSIEKLIKEHDDVLFGKWNVDQTTRTPGILEKIVAIGDQIKLITQIMKYGVLPIMVMDTLQRFGLGNALPAIIKLIPLVLH